MKKKIQKVRRGNFMKFFRNNSCLQLIKQPPKQREQNETRFEDNLPFNRRAGSNEYNTSPNSTCSTKSKDLYPMIELMLGHVDYYYFCADQ